MKILQINTHDKYGGAAAVSWNLHRRYLEKGFNSWLAVGKKVTNDEYVRLIPDEKCRSVWTKSCFHASRFLLNRDNIRGARTLGHCFRRIAEPTRWVKTKLGYEDFSFPGTEHIYSLFPALPSIIHCHNLHGNYFDLRVLPRFSSEFPTVLTLHDAWLLSGHCAHSFNCYRWEIGCGQCPDLTIYPGIQKDATVYNWKRKKKIFSQSRFYLSTPSRWLMDKVNKSMLKPSIIEGRVIPNGIDLSVFKPNNRQVSRKVLNLPKQAEIIIFVARRIINGKWRDYTSMVKAVRLLAKRNSKRKIMFLGIGESLQEERNDNLLIRFLGYQDPSDLARYYQAADMLIHAAKADTFPNAVLEAQACSLPVVATATGGIPEQIIDGETGLLVPEGNSEAMADRMALILRNEELREWMSKKAVLRIKKYFSLNKQVDTFLSWYQKIIEDWKDRTRVENKN